MKKYFPLLFVPIRRSGGFDEGDGLVHISTPHSSTGALTMCGHCDVITEEINSTTPITCRECLEIVDYFANHRIYKRTAGA